MELDFAVARERVPARDCDEHNADVRQRLEARAPLVAPTHLVVTASLTPELTALEPPQPPSRKRKR
jgi:hypothetical protein